MYLQLHHHVEYPDISFQKILPPTRFFLKKASASLPNTLYCPTFSQTGLSHAYMLPQNLYFFSPLILSRGVQETPALSRGVNTQSKHKVKSDRGLN